MLARPRPFAGERTSIALFLLSAAGTVCYLFMASRGGWKILEEQAAGIDVTTGEPFVWAFHVFPIYAFFLLIHLVWAVFLLRKRHGWSGQVWLMTLSLWLVVIRIDFSHH